MIKKFLIPAHLCFLTLFAFGQEKEYQVGDHELLLMPTAYTMPKGKSYFSDYELFLLNYSRAVTSRTHVGIFTLFPITEDFLKTVTLGLKQNYFRSPKAESAFWLTFTPDIGSFTVGNVISVGKRATSLHLGISAAFEAEDDEKEFIFMVGFHAATSERVSFIFEYTNFSSFIEEDFNGLFSIGVRFRGDRMAWEIAGIRPLESSEGLLFFPLLKATVFFD